jgi:small multidrug resistance pump
MAMGWIYLALAIGFEIAGTVNLKLSDGLSRLWPTVAVGVLYVLSFASMSFALKTVALGTAYAIWSAVGIMSIAAIGILWFGEPASTLKLIAVALIVVGVVMLQLASNGAGVGA